MVVPVDPLYDRERCRTRVRQETLQITSWFTTVILGRAQPQDASFPPLLLHHWEVFVCTANKNPHPHGVDSQTKGKEKGLDRNSKKHTSAKYRRFSKSLPDDFPQRSFEMDLSVFPEFAFFVRKGPNILRLCSCEIAFDAYLYVNSRG